jgi:hypothetical protein
VVEHVCISLTKFYTTYNHVSCRSLFKNEAGREGGPEARSAGDEYGRGSSGSVDNLAKMRAQAVVHAKSSAAPTAPDPPPPHPITPPPSSPVQLVQALYLLLLFHLPLRLLVLLFLQTLHLVHASHLH